MAINEKNQTQDELEVLYRFLLNSEDEISLSQALKILKIGGYDVDSMIQSSIEKINAARSGSPFHWRNKNKNEMLSMRESLNKTSEIMNLTRNEIEKRIAEILEALSRTGMQHSVHQFRNLSELNDDDLRSYLGELNYLTKKD